MRTTIIAPFVIGLLTLAASAESPHPEISPSLQEIVDHRSQSFAEESPSFFNRAGLTLTFDLPLSDGYQFARFVEDEISITAQDSAGADLTQLEPTEFGTPKVVEPISTWSDSGTTTEQFKLNLTQPPRDAASVSVVGTIPIEVFASVETIDLEIPMQLAEMPEAVLGPGVKASRGTMGSNMAVTFMPGSLKSSIQSVGLVLPDGTELESTSSMWNEASAIYFFEGEAPEGTFVRLTVRRGVQTVPMRIVIAEMPLP